MKVITIIPARMGSSRFPGKPMAVLCGKPMIGHVYDRVALNPLVTKTVVATPDVEIANYIESIGGVAILTSDTHERASDRCAEALIKAEKIAGYKFDIVIMVQGDEPLTNADMLTEAVQPMMKDMAIDVINLMGKIESEAEFKDRNCIKVVCDTNDYALYFSREPIPTEYRMAFKEASKQVCVIPFRRDYLLEYSNLKPTPLEVAESIDMLRVIESGGRVKMIPTAHSSYSVDTPDDLLRVSNIMSKL